MFKPKNFNLFCLAFSAFFVLGIFWQWRSVFAVEKVVDDVVVETGVFVEKEVKKKAENEKRRAESSNNLKESLKEESLSAKELPEKVNLGVPFTSQAPEKNWEQPWQDACEEAALLMLDAYYKGYGVSPLFARDEIIKMVDWQDGLEWGDSISIERVKKMAEDFVNLKIKNKKLVVVKDPTVEEIKVFLAAGDPVYVVADGHKLPNPYFSGEGPEYHALIIKGYNKDSFITNDPGTWRGENFEYKFDDLMNAIHDWNGGDVENGDRVIMVAK